MSWLSITKLLLSATQPKGFVGLSFLNFLGLLTGYDKTDFYES
ncbi:hypothetical protein APA_165 [Pseudanabaena sp. lw0831]|nr:hypothetical protein APA_165 [Pseudanabaena sp. lw0831]